MTREDKFLKEFAEYLGEKWMRCNGCSHIYIPQTCKRCGEKDLKFCKRCHLIIDNKYRVGFKHGV